MKEEEPDFSLILRASADGRILSGYQGASLKGEQGTDEVARQVVAFLRARDEEWSDPTRPAGPEESVDWQSTGPTGVLRMQITRLPGTQAYYKEVALHGYAEHWARPLELAEQIVAAIRAKAKAIPPQYRSSITLVLDGSRLMGYDFGVTAMEFYRSHSEEASRYGFDDVLLLGSMRLLAILAPPPTPDPWFPEA